jgi:ribosome biogenesis GTPase A
VFTSALLTNDVLLLFLFVLSSFRVEAKIMFPTSLLLKKRPIPLGLSKRRYLQKLFTPGASKPWRAMKHTSDGTMELESHSIDSPARGSSSKRLADRMPLITPGGVTPFSDNPMIGLPTEAPTRLAAPQANEEFPLVFTPQGSESGNDVSTDQRDSHESSDLARLPFGKQLDLSVASVTTNHADSDGAVPMKLQSMKRSRKEAAESVKLPRHLNQLFHKIMGWTNEAVTIDQAHPLVGDSYAKGDSDGNNDELKPLRAKYDVAKQKVQYGLLMDDYEKDRFAVENRLQVEGERFERKFLEWEGMKILDNDAAQAFQETKENKGSLVMHTSNRFRIPVPGRDPCPGCGATLQDKDENQFGFVKRSQIENYIRKETDVVRLRSEYSDRMSELQTHWENNGRRVGEEWLDFMTQDEFDAIYRHKPRAFVCNRCNALENLGTEGRKKVLPAPDFSEQLRALKEKPCVIVLVVDVTDFPGSMVYDLPGLISMNNKVIIAVNKCDCIRMRSFNYKGGDIGISRRLTSERHIKSWVTKIATQFGLPRHQFVDVVPVSANRGWNMEKLLSTIESASNLNLRHSTKPLKTYFVGVANVGKSSLINALAHHLYVPQPPHPESKKVYYSHTNKETGKESIHWRWYTPPNVNRAEMIDIPSRRLKETSKLMTVSSLPGTTVAANAVRISLTGNDGAATYFFDTPGLFPHWHESSPLTLYEMRRTLIRKYRNAECYVLLPGHSLFLGGLAVIDVVRGTPRGLLMMVHTSSKVSNSVVNTEASDEFWSEHLGTLLTPPGSLEQIGDLRLTESKSYLFECFGRHRLRPKADLYVCGLGWVSFCVGEPCDVVLRVRTLPGVVHGVRDPLQYNELRGWNRWPKLTNRYKAKRDMGDNDKTVDKVIRLTSKEVSPEEAASDPLKLVERTQHEKHTASAAAPFADVMAELERHGKLSS